MFRNWKLPAKGVEKGSGMRQTMRYRDALQQDAVVSRMPATGLAAGLLAIVPSRGSCPAPPSSHRTGDAFHSSRLEHLQSELLTTQRKCWTWPGLDTLLRCID